MRTDEALQRLADLHAEAKQLAPTVTSAAFTSWQQKTRAVLTKSLGEAHPVTQAFITIQWTPRAMSTGDIANAQGQRFTRALQEAEGLLDAAGFEIRELHDAIEVAEDAGFDPELWDHVSGHVTAEEWIKVASQTAIYTEDRIRKWTGRPATEVGERLMTTVFGESGDYRMGLTDSEKQGWHRLAMGISMALRNVDLHRIQDRPDLKRYAWVCSVRAVCC